MPEVPVSHVHTATRWGLVQVAAVIIGCSNGSQTNQTIGAASVPGSANSVASSGGTPTAGGANTTPDGMAAPSSGGGSSSSGGGAHLGSGGTANAGSGADASATTAGDAAASNASTPAAGDASPAPGADSGSSAQTVGKLFYLAIVGNEVLSADQSGANPVVLVTGQGVSAPDGIAVDVGGGKMYWTNMGTLTDSPHTPAGSLQRANLDGSQVEVLFQPGATTNTPKQLQLDLVHGKIYWSDREGAEAWRANLDGSGAEVLLSGHGIQELVGMALDVPNGQFYVTDRYAKTVLRAGFQMPSGQDASTRSDVETLYAGQGSVMPIDLDLDLRSRTMYWTDRGVGTIERAAMDFPSGQTASNRTDVTTVVSGLSEPIGISLDLAMGVMYFTELAGQVFRANLDGSGQTSIGTSSGASGITHVFVPM